MTTKTQLVNLKKFNELTENTIPQPLLKIALGIPLNGKSTAKTFHDADLLCGRSASSSESHFFHVDAMIKRASTFSQAMRAYEESLAGTEQRSKAFEKAMYLIVSGEDLEAIKDAIEGKEVSLMEKMLLLKSRIELEGTMTTWLLEKPHDAESLWNHYRKLSRHSESRLKTLKAFCSIATMSEMHYRLDEVLDTDNENAKELRVFADAMLALHEEQKTVLAKPLEDLDLPPEVFNLIMSAKCNSLGELLEFSEEGLNENRKLSKRKIKTIAAYLKTRRLEFPNETTFTIDY